MRLLFKGALYTALAIICALFALRAWVVTHTWELTVIEPAEHGGFGSAFDSEAACNIPLQRFARAGARFKAEGRPDLAPIARCSRPSFFYLP